MGNILRCRESKQQQNEKEFDQEIERLVQKIQPDLSEVRGIPSLGDNPSEEEKVMCKLTKCGFCLAMKKGMRVAVRWLKREPLEELEKDLVG